jgi:hypothetical protein
MQANRFAAGSRRLRSAAPHARPFALVLAFGACALLAGCGDPPVPLEPAGAAPATAATAPQPPQAGEAAVGSGDTLFAGRVRLTGALAEESRGVLNLVVRERGQRMPILLQRFTLDAPEISDPENGVRELRFELSSLDQMGGVGRALPEQLEFRAAYDPDGLVETKEGMVTVEVPVVLGDRSIDVQLPPAVAPN